MSRAGAGSLALLHLSDWAKRQSRGVVLVIMDQTSRSLWVCRSLCRWICRLIRSPASVPPPLSLPSLLLPCCAGLAAEALCGAMLDGTSSSLVQWSRSHTAAQPGRGAGESGRGPFHRVTGPAQLRPLYQCPRARALQPAGRGRWQSAERVLCVRFAGAACGLKQWPPRDGVGITCSRASETLARAPDEGPRPEPRARQGGACLAAEPHLLGGGRACRQGAAPRTISQGPPSLLEDQVPLQDPGRACNVNLECGCRSPWSSLFQPLP